VAENKSRNLLEKVTTLEKKKEDFGRRLTNEKEDAEKAHAEAQAARTEAQAARTEAQAARKHTADLELELKNMCDHRERMESSTRAGVERAHMLFRGCVP
jgi:predicted  nucleic acid-binding Zn-ribbon protein